jgi:hypothetical protein
MMRLFAGFVVGTFFGMYLAATFPNQLRDTLDSLLGMLGK